MTPHKNESDFMHMCSFKLMDYENLLTVFKKANNKFKKFQDITGLKDVPSYPFVIMRHDVDFSLDHALTIAKIEAKHEVFSTFFIKLCSPLYNALSHHSKEVLNEINSLGHDIALHFDPLIYNNDWKIELTKELDVLSVRYYYFNSSIISFHRPSRNIEEIKKRIISKTISHTYEKKYFEELNYFSDSKCQWRYGHPLSSDAFKRRESFHLLTHPIWWVEDGRDRTEKIMNVLERRKKRNISQIENYIISFPLNLTNDEDATDFRG